MENKNSETTIIDAKDAILGRLGSNISKRLLLGEKINVVNCNEVLILGKKEFLVDRYKKKLKNRVIKKGPYYSRNPCDMVKRSFRNMLPYKNERGVLALKNLRCFNSVPSTLISSEKETIESAKVDKSKAFFYTKMKVLCDILGWKGK